MPVSDQIFQALIFGYAKTGQLELADKVIETMISSEEMEVTSQTVGAKLLGMLHHGATYDQIIQANDNLKVKGIVLNDQTVFELVGKEQKNPSAQTQDEVYLL